jgi:hypothetical protein
MADPGHHAPTDREGPPVSRSATRRDWEQVPADPDLHDDLGYTLCDLEAYETDEDRVLFLPRDEDMIRDEAFIIAGEDDLRTLEE